MSAVKCVGCREVACLAQGEVLSEDVLSVVSSKMNSAISILIYTFNCCLALRISKCFSYNYLIPKEMFDDCCVQLLIIMDGERNHSKGLRTVTAPIVFD